MSGWEGVALPPGWTLVVHEELESTNSELLRQAGRVGAGTVVLAERQTAGRGRRGAPWFSRDGEGLTFSVLLEPEAPRGLWPRLSLVCGLAVAEAMEGLGIAVEIKWPNDLLIDGRKVCGILVEAGAHGVVVGIGINVNGSDFAAELGGRATSMQLAGGREFAREEVLGLVLASLRRLAGRLERDFPEVVARIRERCALSGKLVSLEGGSGPLQGRVEGVGDRGELVVVADDGRHEILQAHEVRVLGGDPA